MTLDSKPSTSIFITDGLKALSSWSPIATFDFDFSRTPASLLQRIDRQRRLIVVSAEWNRENKLLVAVTECVRT